MNYPAAWPALASLIHCWSTNPFVRQVQEAWGMN
jgi:hypothetical protein